MVVDGGPARQLLGSLDRHGGGVGKVLAGVDWRAADQETSHPLIVKCLFSSSAPLCRPGGYGATTEQPVYHHWSVFGQ